MKNWMKGLAVGVLALGLSACNDTAEPKKDPETGKPEQVENKSEMTAQEVYKKSMEVSDEQKSMHAKMDIEQSIKMPSEELDMNSNIKMDMDMVIDPMEMYQKMTMDMGEEGSMDIEMYMTGEGFFMNDPESAGLQIVLSGPFPYGFSSRMVKRMLPIRLVSFTCSPT